MYFKQHVKSRLKFLLIKLILSFPSSLCLSESYKVALILSVITRRCQFSGFNLMVWLMVNPVKLYVSVTLVD